MSLNDRVVSTQKTWSGYFSPQDPFWCVNRENLILLAGARAVMLELAHPLVAAGVAQHSNFRGDSLGRLYRTVRMMTGVTFGRVDMARRSIGQTNRCHRPVEGVLTAGVGPFPAGTRYRADDPHLKLWVLATLIDSILMVHGRFVRPLSEAEKESYYDGSCLLGHLLGIPAAVMPATYADFKAYMTTMLASDELTVGDMGREVAQAIFAPPLVGPLLQVISFAGIGLLPPRLRAGFNFPWDEKREKRLQCLAALSRHLRPWLPDLFSIQPEALLAERRIKGKDWRLQIDN